MSLKFGLNVKSFKLSKKKNINLLAADGDDTLENEPLAITQKPPTSITREIQEKALEEDQNLFDYDAAYDEIKATERMKKLANDDGKRPKYMENLIRVANQRKIFLERAKERKIQKEKELQGELYGETEEFVTEAYLKKQQEIKDLEEQERLRDQQDSDPRNKNVAGFYKGILDTVHKKRGPILLGDKDMAKSYMLEYTEKDPEPIQPSSSSVKLNDSEEIVDKRELLTGGLNITSKRARKDEKDKIDEIKYRYEHRKKHDEANKRQYQREKTRNIALIMEQKQEVEKQKHQAEKKSEVQIVAELTSSVAKEKVLDAKARYLARKNANKQ